jgi:hypothetical protein
MEYTEDNTILLVNRYLEAEDKDAVIVELMALFEKPKKSIIGKLSKEGVYQRKTYKTKQGKNPISKKEYVNNIAQALGTDPELIQGLAKTPKVELVYLAELICKSAPVRNS